MATEKRLVDYQVVMWDVLSKDYLQTLSKENVLNESIKATESGSIIVFHDNLKAEENLRYALTKIYRSFQSEKLSI